MLCLADIDSKPSPVCKSDGFSVLTRFQLPWLEQLDDVAVGSEAAREAVELGVSRRRQLGEVNERAAIRDCERRWLTAGLAFLERRRLAAAAGVGGSGSSSGSGNSDSGGGGGGVGASSSVGKWDWEIPELAATIAAERRVLELEIKLNRTKLASYGIVQFKRGGPLQSWHAPCLKMIAERFNAQTFHREGIRAVKVLSAVRVHNSVQARASG